MTKMNLLLISCGTILISIFALNEVYPIKAKAQPAPVRAAAQATPPLPILYTLGPSQKEPQHESAPQVEEREPRASEYRETDSLYQKMEALRSLSEDMNTCNTKDDCLVLLSPICKTMAEPYLINKKYQKQFWDRYDRIVKNYTKEELTDGCLHCDFDYETADCMIGKCIIIKTKDSC